MRVAHLTHCRQKIIVGRMKRSPASSEGVAGEAAMSSFTTVYSAFRSSEIFPVLLNSRIALKGMRAVAEDESKVKLRLQLVGGSVRDHRHGLVPAAARRVRRALEKVVGVLEVR